jgi:hypothetical protein
MDPAPAFVQMVEQYKRGSLQDHSEPSNGDKRLKVQTIEPSNIGEVKRRVEEEDIIGGAVVVVAVAKTMDEPQIKLMFDISVPLPCLPPVGQASFVQGDFFALPSVSLVPKISPFSLPLGSDGIKDLICV